MIEINPVVKEKKGGFLGKLTGGIGGKILGAGLGFMAGGPAGAALGASIGSEVGNTGGALIDAANPGSRKQSSALSTMANSSQGQLARLTDATKTLESNRHLFDLDTFNKTKDILTRAKEAIAGV